LTSLDPLFVPCAEKRQILLQHLNELTLHHAANCPEYKRILSVMHPGFVAASTLADIPYLPIGLFKSHLLLSVPEADIFRVLTSSGTTGQQPSRVVLDRETAQLQSRALAHTMQGVLGNERLPMLIWDSEDILKGDKRFSARAVGILGMMSFGRQFTYALDAGLQLQRDRVREFLEKFGSRPFLMFGFTFMVWQGLYQQAAAGEFDLSQGVLIHSGGWKKLVEQAVSPEEFRRRLDVHCRLRRIHNFYGMVEQVGGVFLEKEEGCLFPSNFSDVIVRDPETFRPVPDGTPGVLQVLSVLPRSYPGHSILTEDLGVVMRENGGFQVLGRIAKAEVRGCSDTAAARV
jgi:hypothetical protein